MRATRKDYYQILGVSDTATNDEIKKAYRRLARVRHPDVAKDKRQAEESFKDLNEANEILSDPRRRRDYDLLRDAPRFNTASYSQDASRETARRTAPFGGRDSQDFDFRFGGTEEGDPFKGRFAKSAGSASPYEDADNVEASPTDLRSPDTEVDVVVSLEEMIRGFIRPLSVHRGVPCAKCRGTGIDEESICPACRGQRHVVTVQHYNVHVPPGVRDGPGMVARSRVSCSSECALPGILTSRCTVTIYVTI
jgi:DnaJ-class molecular chaperone